MNLVYRKNKRFIINREALPEKANSEQVVQAIYGAIYEEFRGASENIYYKNLTPLERLNTLNKYVENWLKERGLYG